MQNQLPKEIDVYFGNVRVVMYVVVTLAMVQAAYALISSDYQEHYRHASIVLYVVLASIFCVLPIVMFLCEVPRTLRHSHWLKDARPYLTFATDRVTLLGETSLPWSAVSYVRLLKLRVGRNFVNLLLLGLEPHAQVRDRSFVHWPGALKEQSEAVAAKQGIDENSFLSIGIAGLTVGIEEVARVAEAYLAASRGEVLAEDQLALACSFSATHARQPAFPGTKLVKRLSWLLLLCWIALLAGWINGGEYWFFVSLDQSARLQSLGTVVMGLFLVLHLVLLGALSAFIDVPQGMPLTIRQLLFLPLLSLIVVGPLAVGLVLSGFAHTLPSVLNEQYGIPFSRAYPVSQKKTVTSRTKTDYLAYLAGENGLEAIQVSLSPVEYRQIEIGSLITISGIRSDYGLSVRAYRVSQPPVNQRLHQLAETS